MGARQTLSSLTLTNASVLPSRLGGAFYGVEGTADQGVAHSTSTLVQFPTAEWNNGITVSGDTSFTLPAGVWSVTANVRFSHINAATNAAGAERYLSIVSAAAPDTVRYSQQSGTPVTADRSVSTTAILRFTTPTAVAVVAWQDSGATLQLRRYWNIHRLHIAWLGWV